MYVPELPPLLMRRPALQATAQQRVQSLGLSSSKRREKVRDGLMQWRCTVTTMYTYVLYYSCTIVQPCVNHVYFTAKITEICSPFMGSDYLRPGREIRSNRSDLRMLRNRMARRWGEGCS